MCCSTGEHTHQKKSEISHLDPFYLGHHILFKKKSMLTVAHEGYVNDKRYEFTIGLNYCRLIVLVNFGCAALNSGSRISKRRRLVS